MDVAAVDDLERFAVAHQLGPSHAHVVGMVLPRSVEVAGTYGAGATWRAFKGLLPGGVRGFVAHVSVPAADGRASSDAWDLVRCRLLGRAPVPELDLWLDGREPLASPFTDGHPRRVPVGRGARLRVSGDASPSDAEAVAAAVRAWLADTGRRFHAELTEGWLTVFRCGASAPPAWDDLCAAAAALHHRLTG